MDQKTSSPLSLPAAIVIAAALIAVAIIWVKKPASSPTAVIPNNAQSITAAIELTPVTVADHILGNPDASILLVEYSDPSCPFCKNFHPTMKKILAEYGPTGDVAWVYRSFPLDKPDPQGRILHPNAGRESQAFECAAELGGNDAFWKYADRLYEITPSDQGKPLDQAELPKIAAFAGLDVTAFNTCLTSGKYADAVESQYLSGVNAGVAGTPATIFVFGKTLPKSMDTVVQNLNIKYPAPTPVFKMSEDRMRIMMSGALPVDAIKAIIDAVLADK